MGQTKEREMMEEEEAFRMRMIENERKEREMQQGKRRLAIEGKVGKKQKRNTKGEGK